MGCTLSEGSDVSSGTVVCNDCGVESTIKYNKYYFILSLKYSRSKQQIQKGNNTI